MREVLCRYCGKPMLIDSIEYTDVWYTCVCKGYQKEKQLKQELRDLECKVYNKRMELAGHQAASLYETTLRELNKKISEIKRTYEE